MGIDDAKKKNTIGITPIIDIDFNLHFQFFNKQQQEWQMANN
jgi:hypothetical protein